MAVAKRVLFVDDEPLILSSLRRQLRGQQQAWEMVFVSSGTEALEEFSKEPFDVVVCDMGMPGMSGVEVLSRVRSSWPQVTAIALSGYTEPEATSSVMRLADSYLAKPCELEALKAAIEGQA